MSALLATGLGSTQFRKDYGLRYAYAAGSMFKGIASRALVVRLGRAGLLGFFGTGGLELDDVERSIQQIQDDLAHGEPYGMNFLCRPNDPDAELRLASLFLRRRVNVIEAASFVHMTPALVLYRVKGLAPDGNGGVRATNRIIAKVSRPEVAAAFLQPPPTYLLDKLLRSEHICAQEASLATRIAMADDLCVEADSGGHTDMGVAFTLLPAIIKLRDAAPIPQYSRRIRVGAAGGIGTPAAAAAAFVLGADFIVTGSINQCTVEADTSAVVKDMLEQLDVRDTTYAPSGDLFELGAKIQVMKRGVFFPGRAQRLHDLWRQHDSLDALDERTRQQLQEQIFGRSFDEVYAETRKYYSQRAPRMLDEAERNPRRKMALVFRWYFVHSNRLARAGDPQHRMDYQIHCGSAQGAFNRWVSGTDLERWTQRHVDDIAERLMQGAAQHLNEWFQASTAPTTAQSSAVPP
jgi:trans-AT polyketide synthase, acyltransferase and oxidoreductase domains